MPKIVILAFNEFFKNVEVNWTLMVTVNSQLDRTWSNLGGGLIIDMPVGKLPWLCSWRRPAHCGRLHSLGSWMNWNGAVKQQLQFPGYGFGGAEPKHAFLAVSWCGFSFRLCHLPWGTLERRVKPNPLSQIALSDYFVTTIGKETKAHPKGCYSFIVRSVRYRLNFVLCSLRNHGSLQRTSQLEFSYKSSLVTPITTEISSPACFCFKRLNRTPNLHTADFPIV